MLCYIMIAKRKSHEGFLDGNHIIFLKW